MSPFHRHRYPMKSYCSQNVVSRNMFLLWDVIKKAMFECYFCWNMKRNKNLGNRHLL